MKGKYVKVTMSDDTQWLIPAEIIAHSRATYFAGVDTAGDEASEEFHRIREEEFEYTMRDHFELLDWANNNMDWKDVAEEAIQYIPPPPPQPDYSKMWTGADKEVVEF